MDGWDGRNAVFPARGQGWDPADLRGRQLASSSLMSCSLLHSSSREQASKPSVTWSVYLSDLIAYVWVSVCVLCVHVSCAVFTWFFLSFLLVRHATLWHSLPAGMEVLGMKNRGEEGKEGKG